MACSSNISNVNIRLHSLPVLRHKRLSVCLSVCRQGVAVPNDPSMLHMSPAFVLQVMVQIACPSSGVSTPLNTGVPKQAAFYLCTLSNKTHKSYRQMFPACSVKCLTILGFRLPQRFFLRIQVFWDVKLLSWVSGYRRFGGSLRLYPLAQLHNATFQKT